MSLFHFEFQFIIFLKFFKMLQEWYENGHLKRNHTKFSKLIFICSIHKHTCEFQHLSTLCEPQEIFFTLYPLFVAFAEFCEMQRMQRIFGGGGAFQCRFPSRHLHRSLLCCAHRRRCPCFSIFVLYFSSVSVFALYDLYVVSKKYIRKIRASSKSKSNLRGEQQPIRLLCF